MDILLCCEHFYPSVGGVQKMMHEIGVRFIKNGHKVTVATSWRKDRISNTINGIKIKLALNLSAFIYCKEYR